MDPSCFSTKMHQFFEVMWIFITSFTLDVLLPHDSPGKFQEFSLHPYHQGVHLCSSGIIVNGFMTTTHFLLLTVTRLDNGWRSKQKTLVSTLQVEVNQCLFNQRIEVTLILGGAGMRQPEVHRIVDHQPYTPTNHWLREEFRTITPKSVSHTYTKQITKPKAFFLLNYSS